MFLIFVIVFNNINFVGFLSNGTQFDSSRDRNKPFRFQLGSCQVVQGLGKCKYIKGAVHSVNSRSQTPIARLHASLLGQSLSEIHTLTQAPSKQVSPGPQSASSEHPGVGSLLQLKATSASIPSPTHGRGTHLLFIPKS